MLNDRHQGLVQKEKSPQHYFGQFRCCGLGILPFERPIWWQRKTRSSLLLNSIQISVFDSNCCNFGFERADGRYWWKIFSRKGTNLNSIPSEQFWWILIGWLIDWWIFDKFMVWIDGRYWWIIFLRNCWDDLNSIPTQYQPPGLKAVQIRFHTKLPAKIEPIWDEITPKRFPWESFYIVHPPSGEVLGVQTLQVSCTQRQYKPPKYLLSFAIRITTSYNLNSYIFQFGQIYFSISTNTF